MDENKHGRVLKENWYKLNEIFLEILLVLIFAIPSSSGVGW
jgi:hypothetical protein